jgi:hypothetical protein
MEAPTAFQAEYQGYVVQSGRYHQHAGEWQLLKWQTALPSRTEITLPPTVPEEISEARKIHHRFGQFASALDEIRARVEEGPVEKGDLEKFCAALGMPTDFDVGLITWKPDYDAFYYRQLRRRARCLYLFRAEYIFDLEGAVVVETPQLGHATYLFSKPASLTEFLSIYSSLTKDDIRHNRNNAAERLGFLGRLRGVGEALSIGCLRSPIYLRSLRSAHGSARP